MSWNVSFTLSRDEDGKAVIRDVIEHGAPDGSYSVTGHTMANDQDWGESIGVVTPNGHVNSLHINPAKRK